MIISCLFLLKCVIVNSFYEQDITKNVLLVVEEVGEKSDPSTLKQQHLSVNVFMHSTLCTSKIHKYYQQNLTESRGTKNDCFQRNVGILVLMH